MPTSIDYTTTTVVSSHRFCEECEQRGVNSVAYADCYVPKRGREYVCIEHFVGHGCSLGPSLGEKLFVTDEERDAYVKAVHSRESTPEQQVMDEELSAAAAAIFPQVSQLCEHGGMSYLLRMQADQIDEDNDEHEEDLTRMSAALRTAALAFL